MRGETSVVYSLLDPTGNLTLLAETPVPPAAQPRAARALMDLEPGAEQAGFLTQDGEGPCLRMAGGEFCGNASMCAAMLFLRRRGREAGTVRVRVSGTPRPVEVVIASGPGGGALGTVAMPAPLSLAPVTLPGGRTLPAARFAGICHVLVEEALPAPEAEALARGLCASLGAEALGLMLLDRGALSLRPLVYVPGAGTLCWESSCASGTAAVGALLAARAGKRLTLPLSQPGGVLEIDADPAGRLRLTGTVRLLKDAAAAALPL